MTLCAPRKEEWKLGHQLQAVQRHGRAAGQGTVLVHVTTPPGGKRSLQLHEDFWWRKKPYERRSPSQERLCVLYLHAGSGQRADRGPGCASNSKNDRDAFC